MDGNPKNIPFVQARDHWPGLASPPQGITIHDMEAPEKGNTAESVARYFQNPSRTGSAHYCIDTDSIVQCVRDTDKAAHAPGVNSTHIGFEHAGYAKQSQKEWKDAYSWAMLQRSAEFAAFKCDQYGIPKVLLSVDDLKRGNVRGITTHGRVTEAFRKSTHTDPGPNFPLAEYIAMVQKGSHTVAPPKSEGFKPGDHGEGVKFLEDMLNIVAKYRVSDKGGHGAQIKNDGIYDEHGGTRAAVAEFQRFLNSMLALQGKKPVPVNGIADGFVLSSLAYWVPKAMGK